MATPRSDLTRRDFLQNSASLVVGAAVASNLPTPFASNWQDCPDRIWLGPAFWANPLQDWRVAGGRAECVNPALDRNVHVLTHSLAEREGAFTVQVRAGRTDGKPLGQGAGSCGFRIGIRGTMTDYRNALLFGRGLDAGLTAAGGLFIGAVSEAKPGTIALDAAEAELRLTGAPSGDEVRLTLTALAAGGRELGTITQSFPRDRCHGGLALVNNFSAPGTAAPGAANAKAKQPGKKAASAGAAGLGGFWFADWRISGSKVDAHPERTFGPLLFSHYTLAGRILKLSAQLPPLGESDSRSSAAPGGRRSPRRRFILKRGWRRFASSIGTTPATRLTGSRMPSRSAATAPKSTRGRARFAAIRRTSR
jgi:alkaline phosphatase D